MKVRGSLAQKMATYGSVIFFFVMALEVMIMISPFAFFFYSVFGPLFNFLGQHAATRWATMFFLPHMILPPTLFLKTVRIAGSVFFVAGMVTFLVCAGQVYLGKVRNRGIAARGLYRVIRHPQYLALAVWGVGLAILWPRFIVLASLALMFSLYYFLARDEERRMLRQYGYSYAQYLGRTGRFLPLRLEQSLVRLADRLLPSPALRRLAVPVLLVAVIMGSGVALREITLRSLPFMAQDNITLVPILPEDQKLEPALLQGLAAGAASGTIPFIKTDRQYLGYVMPADYIMQGMIADTGDRSHLFKHHHTVALIYDWVAHPFEHLRRPPAAHLAARHHVDPALARRHHCPVGIDRPDWDCATCQVRRVILVEVTASGSKTGAPQRLLAGGAIRTPVGFLDIDAQTGAIVKGQRVAKATAWEHVSTPEI
jgi:protein-S-isoprenylcysteine O-methyltransferase Ste14